MKSWLLAIPHLIIVGLLTAPWYWVANGAPTDDYQPPPASLLGLLVLVAGRPCCSPDATHRPCSTW